MRRFVILLLLVVAALVAPSAVAIARAGEAVAGRSAAPTASRSPA